MQLKGITGGRDRRGLFSLAYRYFFGDTDPITALKATLPSTPTNLPEVDRRITEWDVDNNGFIVTATFEGLDSGDSQFAEEDDQYTLTSEWREEPIEAFPDRAALEKSYGAYEDPDTGRLRFPETLEGAATGSTALAKGKKSSERNPLFGVTTYPVMRMVATHSYVRATVPSAVYATIGQVTKNLPAGFQEPPEKVWIKDTPSCRKRGNAWEIVEKWKDVDNLKHLEALYLLLQK